MGTEGGPVGAAGVEWSRSSRNIWVGVARASGTVTICVSGELDINSAPVLARYLYRAVERPSRVVLDLSRVTFCGTAGVDLLLDARGRATEAGGGLTVERAHSAVLHTLEACREPEAWLIAAEVRTMPPPPHEQRQRLSVLEQALLVAFEITGAPMGNAQQYDQTAGVLRIVAQRGFHHPFLSFFETVADRETACGVAAQDHRPVLVDEVTTSPLFLGTPALDVLVDSGIGSVVSVPVTAHDGTLIGVVSTHHPRPTHWTREQRRTLTALTRAARLL
ncbi:STAS domain-containing protein [Streptomyces sp. NPDC087300]|uniref:STAS domain-containing protein n=1 Tax=Streptomyces sp. NPDC087300 TaxID=3365780 RepID=UPI0038266EA0